MTTLNIVLIIDNFKKCNRKIKVFFDKIKKLYNLQLVFIKLFLILFYWLSLTMKKISGFSSSKISTKRTKATAKKPAPDTKKPIQKVESFFANQEIKSDLKSFYNTEAKKYSETRKKFWQEEEALLNTIMPIFNSKNKVKVLEFWCWSGRFATLLNQNFAGKFEYIWIDLSEELLSYAWKDNPNLTFLQWDITKCINNFEQESFDLIVWTSSFQHIPTAKERSFLMKNFYRLLAYDGILLMTNWSLSSRFIRKHRKIVWKSRISSRIKFNKNIARDLLVPRTDNTTWKTFDRFYHFFSLEELKKLTIFSGLTIKTLKFLDEKWWFTDNEKVSRSSILVAKKSPIED